MTDFSALPRKNRRGGLIFFGIVELAMGGLCLLLFAFTILSIFVAGNAPGAPPIRPAQMIPAISMYLIAGVVLAILGIGSMMPRRWARDLSLITAWAWLIIGVMTTLAMIVLVPSLMPRMPADQAQATTFAMTCMTVVFGFFGIVVPLALVLFYRSPNVRATVVALDAHPRWTERVPLPLLALALWSVVTGISMIAMSSYAVLPLGREIIIGPAAIAIYCLLGLLFLYIAWGLYHRSRLAWWIGMAYSVIAAAYCAIAFPNLDYDKLTAAMHVPKTPGVPDFGSIYSNPWFLAYLAVFWLLYIGYFVFVRRYLPARNP